jgi:drug/metabolite transporter (DMT)-like permease
MQRNEAQGAAEMASAMFISGTIGWFVITAQQPVAVVVFWRCVFGGIALLVICAATGVLHRKIVSRRQLALAAAGGLAVVLNWLLLFAAFPRSSISVATTIYNTQPFILVMLGALLLGERITALKIFWLALAFLGVVALVESGNTSSATGSAYLAGILLALGAAFFYAITAVVAKQLAGVPPIIVVLIQVCVGAITLAPFVFGNAWPVSSDAWAMLAILGVVHTGIVFVLLYRGIQKLPTHVTGALSFIYPVVAMIVDALAFGQRLQPMQIAGAALVLFAAAGTTFGWSPAGRLRQWLDASKSC